MRRLVNLSRLQADRLQLPLRTANRGNPRSVPSTPGQRIIELLGTVSMCRNRWCRPFPEVVLRPLEQAHRERGENGFPFCSRPLEGRAGRGGGETPELFFLRSPCPCKSASRDVAS